MITKYVIVKRELIDEFYRETVYKEINAKVDKEYYRAEYLDALNRRETKSFIDSMKSIYQLEIRMEREYKSLKHVLYKIKNKRFFGLF